VEEVLYRHPAARVCAMIGVPHEHEEGKELSIRYVVLNDRRTLTLKMPREYLSEHVAHYKMPRRFILCERSAQDRDGRDPEEGPRKLYQETETKHR
jgi:acyl-CoA synthetase (AMP-forming)/AMP-acid ligase II